MKKIALIPIDNRPICYNLIKDICAIDDDIKLFMPDRDLLGGLENASNIDKIFKWLDCLKNIDYLILSLDTITYGGLITSRRCEDSFEDIKSRVLKLRNIVKKKKCKTYAFSSIMRISNNNINEEEKIYWENWGKEIFKYSYNLHKSHLENKKEPKCKIPKEIIDDYLYTRKRNFEINKLYLEMTDIFDFLVYSKDDSGKFGLNVEEAEFLAKEIKKRRINAKVKTGADEIPLSLLTRAITDGKNFKINSEFFFDKSTKLISKYEDISIFDCVKGQIELAGAKLVKGKSDIIAIINNFEKKQGDLCLGDLVNKTKISYDSPNFPHILIDINNANGADDNFIENIFDNGYSNSLFSYAGYNTTANTIGCAICIAAVKYFAKKFNEDNFKKLLFIRFMDDWAYQAHIRKTNEKFSLYEKKVNKFLNTDFKNIKYIKPWNRSFEVEIVV